MQTELIDVAMKAIAAHVAAPFKLRIAELEQQVSTGTAPDTTAMQDELESLRIRLKQSMDHGEAVEAKLEQARKIQGGMQKKNDALQAEISELVARGPSGAAEDELRKHLAAANAQIKKLEQENRNLRGELSGKRFAAKSTLHKAVVERPAEPETRPQPPKSGVGHGGLVLSASDAREWDHQ